MILTPADVRTVRPIAENIPDVLRLETYLRESERLRLVDVLGAKLYRWLDETDFTGDGPFEYPVNGTILTKEQYTELMHGGYFDTKCASGKSEGIVTAIAYIAYSRFVVNNPINVTAFGVVQKNGEFSTAINDTILIRTSNEARKVGEAYLKEVVEHCKALGLLACTEYREHQPHMIRVGRRKL